MARRRALAALVVVAVIATAWLLFGRRDVDRAQRAEVRPAGGPALPKLDPAKKPAPDGAAAAAPGAAKPEAKAPATAQLRVRVLDADRAPAGGATVEAHATPGDLFPRREPAAVATTARDGTATLAVAPSVPYLVRACRGETANIPAVIVPDGAEATLVLEPSRGLRGLVLLAEGGPARAYWVNLTFAHGGHAVRLGGKTDEGGAFDLPPFPDAWLDRLTVEVMLPGEKIRKAVEKRNDPYHWEFEFWREQLLAGTITLQLTVVRLRARVVDEAGVPVAHASVHWAPPGAPDPPSFRFIAVTDEDGRFEAAVQRLGGEAFVIRAGGYAPLVWRPEAPPGDRKLQVPEIVLRRGASLSGRVTDPAGQPIRAVVRLESPRLPGQVVEEDMIDDDGRFRFDVADEDHVLYAFRPVEPDLCLPQLRMPGARGGPHEVRVVLPEPIHGTVRFVAHGTGEATSVGHLTLIVKDARGAEVAKRTWEPSQSLGEARFEVWAEGTYGLEVYTARHEPARVDGVQVVRGRGPEVAVPLVPRR